MIRETIFPSEAILNGKLHGGAKIYVWRDICILHKTINKTFYPSRTADDELILTGEITVDSTPIQLQIILPKDYISTTGVLQAHPIFQITKLPKGKMVVSKLFNKRILDIDKLVPRFSDNPSLSYLLKTFNDHFQRNPLLCDGKDIIDQIRPEVEKINRSLTTANESRMHKELYNNFKSTLSEIKRDLSQYSEQLNVVKEELEEAKAQQSLTFTPQFEQNLTEYSNARKYDETRLFMENLFDNNLISAIEYINAVKEISTREFEEQIWPSIRKSLK